MKHIWQFIFGIVILGTTGSSLWSAMLFSAFVCKDTANPQSQKPLPITKARVAVTGHDINRPPIYPGRGKFGWPGNIQRLPGGDLILVHSAGYWHSSFAQPRLFESALRKRWSAQGWPLDFPAPTGGRSMIVRSKDGGKTWSKPKTILDLKWDDGPTGLLQCKDRTLLCFVNVQASWYGFDKAPKKFQRDLDGLNTSQGVIRSTDNGKTWSDPIWLKGPGKFYERSHAQAIQLSSGAILWPTYCLDSRTGREYGVIHRSVDSGRSWRVHSTIRRKGKPVDEPAIGRLPGGRLIMICRPDGCIFVSDDDGRTWKEDARIPVRGVLKAPWIGVLADGTVVCVCTYEGRLHVFLGTRRGRRWSRPLPLDDSAYGYPGGLKLKDDSILVSYTSSGRAPNLIYVARFRVNAQRDGIELVAIGNKASGTSHPHVRPTIPRPAIMMFGYSDNQRVAARHGTHDRRPLWAETMKTANIIEGVTSDAELVVRLRSRGGVFAYHVHNKIKAGDSVDAVVKAWSAPLKHDLNGRLPGGFDAISIDELHPWPDGDVRSKTVVKALRQIRADHPKKIIIAACRWQLAYSGLPGVQKAVFDEQLRALRDCVDLIFLEAYLSEHNPQFHLFPAMAANLNRRVPGLLNKTIFGLAIPQNMKFPYGDSSPYVEFRDFLDEQIYRIRGHSLGKRMPGIGFWVAYRARPSTVIHAMNLARHYYLKKKNTHFGDGAYSQRVKNPSFENGPDNWSISPGAAVIDYASVANLPAYHSAKFASHERKLLRMTRRKQANVARQLVAVKPMTTYTLSAWVAGSSPSIPFAAGLEITSGLGAKFWKRSKRFDQLRSIDNTIRCWQRVAFTFTTPPGVRNISVKLTDGPARGGETLYWDFVELEEDYAPTKTPESAQDRPKR